VGQTVLKKTPVRKAEPKHKANNRAGQKLERGLKTRDAILDVAEAVLNEEGLGVSLRRIMVVAGVNVTSINYHFGQREKLIEAVVERRSKIINEERLALLEQAEIRQAIPSVADIVTAYFEPSFNPKRISDPGWRNYLRILSRLSLESGKSYRDLIARYYDPLHGRFLQAFRKALPDLPEDEIIWRYHTMHAIAIRAFPTPRPLNIVSSKLAGGVTPEESLRNVLPLMIHLFAAPPLSTLQALFGPRPH
jgi:AcrR family transcriptional regulator